VKHSQKAIQNISTQAWSVDKTEEANSKQVSCR